MMNRRSFLRMAAQSGAAAWWMNAAGRSGVAPGSAERKTAARPNLLVILVDQWRYPQWFPDQATLDALLPNAAWLRQGAVDFTAHFAAATACTPSRACMLTGLYAHQHFCSITNVSHMQPAFPTWGTFLRNFGYDTYWFGKWHVSADEGGESTPPYSYLEPYGFTAYTHDFHGTPGQGMREDGGIATAFADWLDTAGSEKPWCTTVSFVNPHDIMFYPRYMPAGEDNPPSVFAARPPNFETRTAIDENKPALQLELIRATNRQFGEMSYLQTPQAEQEWIKLLDSYLYLEQMVDAEIGDILAALDAHPAVKANTVVVFTCDHGEYGGSHGLRGKGGAAYEESIRVPFYVKDLTGTLGLQPGERTQLTSHVDLTPLLLTLGYGSGAWRSLPECSHLAGRFDMAPLLQDAAAAGRPYVLHTTDEPGTEEKVDVDYLPFDEEVPNHVVCYRTAAGKFSAYQFWAKDTTDILADGQQTECYDYATDAGRKEIANLQDAGNALYVELKTALETALYTELRAPLPLVLQGAQQAAKAAYLAEIGQNGWRNAMPDIRNGG